MVGNCCLRGFKWDGHPVGSDTKVEGIDCYISNPGSKIAIILIHDIFGWTFLNNRLLADHLADEAGATVYLPDVFGGEVIPPDEILNNPQNLDIPSFLQRNSKDIRWPEILSIAKHVRSKHDRVGATGYCYGGWAVFRLGEKGLNVVDAISTAHPTLLTPEEMQKVAVPVQILAPEHDDMFTEELKATANKIIPTLGVPYDYQYFPGLRHGFAIRGDEKNPAERAGMVRAKNDVVHWFRQWLLDAAKFD